MQMERKALSGCRTSTNKDTIGGTLYTVSEILKQSVGGVKCSLENFESQTNMEIVF